ncbi:hypothetical protein ABPG72_005568 [Tetrahymena utriculariae]
MSYHQQMFVSDNLTDYLAHQNQHQHMYSNFYGGLNNAVNMNQQIKRTPKLTECDKTDVTHSSIQTASLNQNSAYVVEHLDLDNFKNQQCKTNTQHNHKHCPFYHNSKDRKRPGHFYSSDLCQHIEKNEGCPDGDDCKFSHNRVEQLYQPEKYKTKFCTFYPNNINQCEYGVFCSFAHSENDIVIELIHNLEYDDDFYMFYFKTVWCPFNLAQHDKALCVYAHNWQDYRRKPSQFYYEPNSCTSWSPTNYILNYEDGCPLKFDCNKCHGWKELEYHPRNYKTKACPNQKPCNKQNDCPFYHHGPKSDKRTINANIQNKIFRFVPKNRIITNTFKVRNSDSINSIPGLNNSQFNPQLIQQSQLQYISQSQQQQNEYAQQQQQQQQQQQNFFLKGTTSMFNLPSSQQAQNQQSWNPHNSQQIGLNVFYQTNIQPIKQNGNGYYLNNMSTPQQNVGSQQLLDTPPIADNRLKLSKKKKDNQNGTNSAHNNGNNSGKMLAKDNFDNEVWLGRGGSRPMDDSFEIEPQGSNKNDKFASQVTHKEENELSGSQNFLQDKFSTNNTGRSPYLSQTNKGDYQKYSNDKNSALTEFNSYNKDNNKATASFINDTNDLAISQHLQTEQMFKDLAIDCPQIQKQSYEQSHDSMTKRDEDEMARNVMHLVDE